MNLFTGKAEHYERGRPDHDGRVRAFLEDILDPAGAVLELGAGTGKGTTILENVFQSIRAVANQTLLGTALPRRPESVAVRQA